MSEQKQHNMTQNLVSPGEMEKRRGRSNGNGSTESGRSSHGAAPFAEDDPRSVYTNSDYVNNREETLAIVPKTSWLNSVDRYASSLAIGIFLATAGSFGGVPLLLSLAGFGAGLLITAWGIHSHYQSRKLSAPVDIKRGEEMTLASAKIHAKEQAKELGKVLTEHFEPKRPERERFSRTYARDAMHPGSWGQRTALQTAGAHQEGRNF